MTQLSEAIVFAALDFDRSAVADTMEELSPWLRHFEGCSRRGECECGLNTVLRALKEESEE